MDKEVSITLHPPLLSKSQLKPVDYTQYVVFDLNVLLLSTLSAKGSTQQEQTL